MNPQTNVFGALLLSGLLGSLGHCLGMCGPLVMMIGARFGGHGRPVVAYHLLYHSARVAVYALLGAGVGGLGLILGSWLHHLAGVISLSFGVGVVLFGLGYLGWSLPRQAEGRGAWINRAMTSALQRGGPLGVLSLGALNGLLPCGLVYGALLMAGSTGKPFSAALGMVVFGAGTLPALLVAGLGAGMLSIRVRQTMARVAGVAIVIVGLQLGLRGMASLGWVGHLRLGGLMIW
jgi:sulfite exporter TauE/SafE